MGIIKSNFKGGDNMGGMKNLAVALAVRKHNQKKMMAEGGMVPKEDEAMGHDKIEHMQPNKNQELSPGMPSAQDTIDEIKDEHLGHDAHEHDVTRKVYASKGGMIDKVLAKRMAHGGAVEEPESAEMEDSNEIAQDDDFLSEDANQDAEVRKSMIRSFLRGER